MLIKKIISICKESKTLISMITKSGKLMWIGNEYAAYPAYSVPVMNPEEILQMHDIPEDKSLSYSLREESLPFSPEPAGRAFMLEAMPVRIEVLGVSYQPFILPLTNRIYYIDTAYFAPFADCTTEKQYFLRHNIITGNPLIMVFAGLTPLAAISPAELSWEQVYQSCTLLMADASNKLGEQNQRQEDDDSPQMTMEESAEDGAETADE